MRWILPAVALLAALAACDGDDGAESLATPSPAPNVPPATSPSPTETGSPTATPSPTPRPIPPAWASPIERALSPDALPDAALVPPDATLTGRVTLSSGAGLPDQVAVAYTIGADPFAAEHGVAVWQRFDEAPAWSVVFAFVDPPRRGVLGIELQSGDATGDGHDDVLVFELVGGTGACGRWRLIEASPAGTATPFSRRTCDTEIRVDDGALVMREAVYGPDDPHCCPSAFRTTTLQWDGEAFEATEVVEEPVPSP